MISVLAVLFFFLGGCCCSCAAAERPIVVFHARGPVAQLKEALSSLAKHSGIIPGLATVVCVPREDEAISKAVKQWPASVFVGHRNACLSHVQTSAADSGGDDTAILMFDSNARLVFNNTIQSLRPDVLYGVAIDQDGELVEWTPLFVRKGARCGFMGRFICVDNSRAYKKLSATRYELDVSPEDRELIDGASVASFQTLRDVSITRHPPTELASDDPRGPADPEFAHAWYLLGRVHEASGNWVLAEQAYAKRLALGGETHDMWYAMYRLGVHAETLETATPYLLEAYDMVC